MEKDPQIFVVHILDEIAYLQKIPRRRTLPEFLADDDLTRSAAYSMQIISEAARRLPPEWLESRPEVSWHHVKAIGNRTRHEYADLRMPTLWNIMLHELDDLKRAMEAFRQPEQD